MSKLAFLIAFLAQAGSAQADYSAISLLPGDYPDPSITRVGADYWAAATSSAWAPEFPILHSRDLTHWEVAGAVFKQRPEWAVGDFWAPEITTREGRFYVYYAARKKNGPICVGVATSVTPTGPYLDHGPIACDVAGAIDPAPIVDEKGDSYLVWKIDGNSVSQPAPLVAQKLSPDGLKLVGARTELFRNDPFSWEGGLVEGPFVLRHDGWFYLFYSGASCCTLQCNYALGVARSRKLLGPWEKNPHNPILAGNESWKCPGHGSIVADPEGQDFLLYHAMSTRDSVYVGRQPLIDQIHWYGPSGEGGWPTINDGKGPLNEPSFKLTARERQALKVFSDDFSKPELIPGWQWPQDNEPVVKLEHSGGASYLLLKPGSAASKRDSYARGVLARSTMTLDYRAETQIDLRGLLPATQAGLSAYGSAEQSLGISVGEGKISFWHHQRRSTQAMTAVIPPEMSRIRLRMDVSQGNRFKFSFSGDGHSWAQVGNTFVTSALPPWDLGVRVALTVGGTGAGPVRFDWLRILPSRL